MQNPRELRAFARQEFDQRIERARRLMTRERLDALLLTSEQNLEYLSGFTTQFAWNTPTRPWYFLVPRTGECLGVIPEVGATNWQLTSWCERVLTWPSPRPEDEGISLLADAITRLRRRYGRIGMELGPEQRLGMPVLDMQHLAELVKPAEVADGTAVMRELRMIKSPAEVSRIERMCRLACDTFDALPGLVELGDSEKTIVRKFQADLLLRGADKTPYVSIGTGKGGYTSIIQGPTTRKLARGDVLLIDTGARYEGYFCDFDRNFVFGRAGDAVKRVHELLWRATEAGIAACVPGNTAEQVFETQAQVLVDGGVTVGNVGRFGHGLGKHMTEPPSNRPGDHTRLAPGMVLTVEPSALFGRGRILAHEEDVVITEDGPRLLTRRAPRELPEVEV